ncbi:MAG: hypothetical protein RBT33_00895 [Candidatus Dojkabacteria bacterium]|jgi:ATP-dependent DNA ligase|nr:hypothetical protein [Candidatus Dojkabacteria bacterium]MDX9738910.1 hypothetical protein [Candidatus Dojkabacteria bacterium]
MIEQCKATDISKLSTKQLIALTKSNPNVMVSTKYDGHYIQIHKRGRNISFFTSGNKEFRLPALERLICSGLKHLDEEFILEAEYIGASKGKLGDRRFAGNTTTWRTEFSKGIHSEINVAKETFVVFDIINASAYGNSYPNFEDRLRVLNKLELTGLVKAKHTLMSFSDAAKVAKELVAQGWEGAIAKYPSHMYKPGSRVKTALKIKFRPTADLVCIGCLSGEGKYSNMIGSLVLKDPITLETVNVGSGLTDELRAKGVEYFIGKVVEISYDTKHESYIQPVYQGLK